MQRAGRGPLKPARLPESTKRMALSLLSPLHLAHLQHTPPPEKVKRQFRKFCASALGGCQFLPRVAVSPRGLHCKATETFMGYFPGTRSRTPSACLDHVPVKPRPPTARLDPVPAKQIGPHRASLHRPSFVGADSPHINRRAVGTGRRGFPPGRCPGGIQDRGAGRRPPPPRRR